MIRPPPRSTPTVTLVPYTTLFRSEKQLQAVGGSLAALKAALAESENFRRLTTSPLISRDEAVKAVGATASAMKLDPITANFLGVLAQNRRLGQLGNVIRAFNLLAAAHRGETTADVTSAHPLSDDQVRSEERREGKGWVSTCRSRWSPYHSKK